MKRDHLIRLDSELGKRIGLTSGNFESAIVWDCRPNFLYFTLLVPRQPEEQIIKELFRALDGIYTPCWFNAPTTLVKKIAEQHGYEHGSEKCGTTFMHNLKAKNLSRIKNQQH